MSYPTYPTAHAATHPSPTASGASPPQPFPAPRAPDPGHAPLGRLRRLLALAAHCIRPLARNCVKNAPIDTVSGALNRLLGACQDSDAASFRNGLDPAMIGYQRQMDDLHKLFAGQMHIHIHLLETHLVRDLDNVVVLARWTRRSLARDDLKAQAAQGNAELLFVLVHRRWLLHAIAGDNPFVP